MNLFDTAAVLLVLAALFSFLNTRFLRFPSTIGLLLSGLMASGMILILDEIFPAWGLGQNVFDLIQGIDFTEFLMHGMLSFLLFAGALHANFDDLMEKKWPILTLASFGVLISTALIGFGSYGLFKMIGIPVALPYCLVFGALISPTDPIAVLGIMKSVGAPKSLETKVAGESLFNDGIGVVVFSVLLAAAGGSSHGGGLHGFSVVEVFLREVLGGLLLGLVAGLLVYQLMKQVEEKNLEILLSLALVMGITFVAFQLHTSAPLACVVAGLFIGNQGRRFAMSDPTRESLDLVWSFTDYMMNAVLFLLLGLEVVALSLSGRTVLSLVLVIPLILVARFICVSIPILTLGLKYEFSPGAIPILTWGGLRGGISVALALSLPIFEGRGAILNATYGVVVFSILVQGLTIGPLIRRLTKQGSVLK